MKASGDQVGWRKRKLTWVRGKTRINFCTSQGISSIGKKVPLKKAMGMMKKLVKLAASSWERDNSPTMTPMDADKKQFSSQAERKITDKVRWLPTR